MERHLGSAEVFLRKEIVDLAWQLQVKLSGETKKGDIIAQLVSKSRLGTLQVEPNEEDRGLSYMTDDVHWEDLAVAAKVL